MTSGLLDEFVELSNEKVLILKTKWAIHMYSTENTVCKKTTFAGKNIMHQQVSEEYTDIQ